MCGKRSINISDVDKHRAIRKRKEFKNAQIQFKNFFLINDIKQLEV